MHSLLETEIGYFFNDKTLLAQALTHVSAARKRQDRGYERLEFLGDRVLALIVADMLFALFPFEREGQIAKRHAALVCRTALATVARNIDLPRYVQFSVQERGHHLKNETLQADVCEALLGALYLDGGLEAAKKFVTVYWHPLLDMTEKPPIDAKSALQEWAQGRGLPRPEYVVVGTVGPDHQPHFCVEVTVNGLPPCRAEGASKKKAEQLAAQKLLELATT